MAFGQPEIRHIIRDLTFLIFGILVLVFMKGFYIFIGVLCLIIGSSSWKVFIPIDRQLFTSICDGYNSRVEKLILQGLDLWYKDNDNVKEKMD